MPPSTGSTMRCRPSPVWLYWQSALTDSTFSASSPSSAIRESAKTAAGSRARPFRVISWTGPSVTRSAKVAVPGSAVKRMTLVEPKFSAPAVRSSSTS
jgi:hypothetical protein